VLEFIEARAQDIDLPLLRFEPFLQLAVLLDQCANVVGRNGLSDGRAHEPGGRKSGQHQPNQRARKVRHHWAAMERVVARPGTASHGDVKQWDSGRCWRDAPRVPANVRSRQRANRAPATFVPTTSVAANETEKDSAPR
jgi:hypothetical protein